MDFPHQGLLNITNLNSHDLQLAFKNVTTLAVEMCHHHIPLLILVVLSPVPFKLLQRLLGVIKTNGEVIHRFAVGVVELVDPLDVAFQVLDPLLYLDDGDIENAIVDSLIFESCLD